MDTVNYSRKRFEEIKKEVGTKILKRVGFKPRNVTFIPISASNLSNMVSSSERMPWSGLYLLKALLKMKVPKLSADNNKLLRIALHKVIK